MKVLITVATYYPCVNGVQNVTQYQAEGLVKLGHDVTVITGLSPQKLKKVPREEVYNGVRIIRVAASKKWTINYGEKRKYRKIVRDNLTDADLMMNICPTNWNVNWVLALIRKEQVSCPTLLMVHGLYDFRLSRPPEKSLYGILKKTVNAIRLPLFFALNWKVIKKYTAIIQLHEKDFAMQYFKKHGVEKQYILYNAVEDAFFDADVEKEKQIVNVGTYCTNKNQEKALEAFYKADLPDYKLVLIGSKQNKYYDHLQTLIEKLEQLYGHRDVELCVGITRSETITKVKQSQIYLLTSVSEIFPVSLIEGMAAGCAWVSTDVGIDRYLPGGVIADKLDDIADAVEQLAADNNWKQQGVLSRNFAFENCRKARQVRRLEEIMHSAITIETKE